MLDVELFRHTRRARVIHAGSEREEPAFVSGVVEGVRSVDATVRTPGLVNGRAGEGEEGGAVGGGEIVDDRLQSFFELGGREEDRFGNGEKRVLLENRLAMKDVTSSDESFALARNVGDAV
jgi:hypothetical protein